MDNSMDEENQDTVPRQNPRTPFTQLAQVDSDLALAKVLQEQERAFMALGMNRDDNNDDNDNDALRMNRDDDNGDNENDADDENDDSSDGVDEDDYDEFILDNEIEELDWEMEDPDEEDAYSQDLDQGSEAEELSYEEFISLGEVAGTENRGLAMDVLSSLPSTTYNSQPTVHDTFNQCVICQVDYEDGEKVVILPCKHPYHSNCIIKWLQINKVCPICGHEVSVPEPMST